MAEVNQMRDTFREALRLYRTTFLLFSPYSKEVTPEAGEETKSREVPLERVYFSFDYITKRMDLKQELIIDLGLTDADA